MKIIRLSGSINNSKDTDDLRELRAQVLYTLFANGWTIYNANGDQEISLNNIEKKIIEANAFMFMPQPDLQDFFKVVSIFVGYQTQDPHLSKKPTVVLNPDKSWNSLFELLDNLAELGTIQQDYRNYLFEVESPEQALSCLQKLSPSVYEPSTKSPEAKTQTHMPPSYDHSVEQALKSFICVFCSASIKDEDYLQEGYQLGQLLAEENLGCVSGAGKTGVMGEVVRGCVEHKGWAGGSNVPHIIELEGLPQGLSSLWVRADIYTRMEVMIEKSDSFVIFPGGAGTLQEWLALLILKGMQHPSMQDKSIIVYNKYSKNAAQGFWDKAIAMLQHLATDNLPDFTVVDSFDALKTAVSSPLAHAQ